MTKMRVVSFVIVAALAAPLTLAGRASPSEERAAGGTHVGQQVYNDIRVVPRT